MSASKELVQAASSVKTVAETGWKAMYETHRMFLAARQMHVGLNGLGMLIDGNTNSIELTVDNSAPVTIHKDRVDFPGSIRVNNPENVIVSDGLALNPEGIMASTIMTPVPAFKGLPGRLDGILQGVAGL